MHARAREVARDTLAVGVQTEHDYYAARLVFAEETAASAAYHEDGDFAAVFLHVYARAVARIALDVDFAAAHRVSRRVARIASDYYFAVVHRIADRVLRVAVHDYLRAVEISPEGVAGNTFDLYRLVRETRADEPLADTTCYLAIFLCGAYARVKRGVVCRARVQYDHYNIPPCS